MALSAVTSSNAPHLQRMQHTWSTLWHNLGSTWRTQNSLCHHPAAKLAWVGRELSHLRLEPGTGAGEAVPDSGGGVTTVAAADIDNEAVRAQKWSQKGIGWINATPCAHMFKGTAPHNLCRSLDAAMQWD
jgi:hypothetical protein